MQPATDEQTLIAATEARLSEIFGAQIAVLRRRRRSDRRPHRDRRVADQPGLGRAGAHRRAARAGHAPHPVARTCDAAVARPACSASCSRTSACSASARSRISSRRSCACRSSKSELKALRAQINPHFLFNALNAIASLIHTDPGRADEAVEQLAEVFRYTLRRSDSEWAPLDQELTFARAYLDVEQARFGQRLTCTIDSDHLPPAPLVPSMLLQTLLENAVKHGVSQTRGPGRIDVIVRTTPDQVTIEVRNTGPGAGMRTACAARDGEGFGLHSVRERLKGHFGDRASFPLTRDETAGVTVARIAMPHVRMAA